MKKYKILLFVIVMSCISNVYMWGTTKPLSKNRIDLFSLSEVRITDKYFKHIQDLDHQYLLTLEPDRLLSWFRREAGLTPSSTLSFLGIRRCVGRRTISWTYSWFLYVLHVYDVSDNK